jgi:hypothetical protein
MAPAAAPAEGAEVDATGFLSGLSKSLDSIGGDVRAMLAGHQAQGEMLKSLAAENAGLKAELAVLKGATSDLAKAMRLPQPGRAVTGATPVEHPVGDAHQPVSRGALIKSMQDAWAATPDPQLKAALAQHIGAVNAGAAPNAALLKAVGINC